MIQLSLERLSAVLGCVPPTTEVDFCGVSIDTTRAQPGHLFIAVRSGDFDGHRCMTEAVAQGAVAAVVEPGGAAVPVPHLCVEDTQKALNRLARFWLDRVSPRVIGITG